MAHQEPIDTLGGFPKPGQVFVDEAKFEDEMEAIFAASDPETGILGPNSMSWEVYSQTVVWFGALRASLLQTLHPGIATALVEKSTADNAKRLETTIAFFDGVVFGTVDEARKLARMLHAKHMGVSGTIRAPGGVFAGGDRYEGNDLEALWWVLATILDTAVLLYERYIRPLSPAEKDRLMTELPLIGAMFGIPRAALPADWASFRGYFSAMIEGPRTAVTESGRAAAASVLAVSGPSPVVRMVRALSIAWLPDRAREAHGLALDARTRAVAAVGDRFVRTYLAVQPARKRRAKGFIDARIRLGLSPLP